MKRFIFAVAVAVMFAGCAQKEQQFSHMKSSFFGLDRQVTLYSADGKVLGQWTGHYNVQTSGGTARFIDKGKAITISGTFTIIEQ